MKEQIIIASIVALAVVILAIIYYWRIKHLRDAQSAPDTPIDGASNMEQEIPPTRISSPLIDGNFTREQAAYLVDYICLLRLPVRGSKRVSIRDEYHKRIKHITRTVGRGTTITEYVDKVLKQHFEEHQHTIDQLLSEYAEHPNRQHDDR